MSYMHKTSDHDVPLMVCMETTHPYFLRIAHPDDKKSESYLLTDVYHLVPLWKLTKNSAQCIQNPTGQNKLETVEIDGSSCVDL